MGKFIDLTGQRFGRLVVVGCADRDNRGRAKWRCRCDCGKERLAASYHTITKKGAFLRRPYFLGGDLIGNANYARYS